MTTRTWSEWKLRRFLSNLKAVVSSVLLLDGGGLMALLCTAEGYNNNLVIRTHRDITQPDDDPGLGLGSCPQLSAAKLTSS